MLFLNSLFLYLEKLDLLLKLCSFSFDLGILDLNSSLDLVVLISLVFLNLEVSTFVHFGLNLLKIFFCLSDALFDLLFFEKSLLIFVLKSCE